MKKTPFAILMTSCFSLCMPFLSAEENQLPSSPTTQKLQDEYAEQKQQLAERESATIQSEANSRRQQVGKLRFAPPTRSQNQVAVEAENPARNHEPVATQQLSTEQSDSLEKPVIQNQVKQQLQPSPRPPALVDNQQEQGQDSNGIIRVDSTDCCQPVMVCCRPLEPPCIEPRAEDGRFLWVSGEFLYWRAFAPSLDFGISNNQLDFVLNGTDLPLNGLRGNIYKAEYDWEPGFRIGLGTLLPHDDWELTADYTWYRGRGSKTVNAPAISAIQNALPIGQLVSTIADASRNNLPPQQGDRQMISKLNLHYQTADLLIGHAFSLTNYLDVKIAGGLEGGWLSQKWKVVNYDFPLEFPPAPNAIVTNKMNWDFNGGGLQLGVDTNWYFIRSLNLRLSGAFSMLYGRHKSHYLTQPSNGFSFEAPVNDITVKDMRVVTHSQLAIELAWHCPLSICNATALSIFAGYELHVWNNMHEVYRNADDQLNSGVPIWAPIPRSVDVGPLTLQGINVGATLSF